ncbi:Meiosis-specific with OB domain-containing protein [Taenia solium]|eukprot:TsM_000242600 transcript=TsM_000242600 gene=TsM_000242600
MEKKVLFQLSISPPGLVEYNVFLNLTDHTGTYTRCTFTNSAMENIFGMQAKDFLQLSLSDRGRLKWKLLLNRYKVYFWMRQPGYDQPTPCLNVLACERPNPFEVYSSLPTANCQ